ncbi:N-acetylneuraminate lyase-like isoform X1 [Diorhabda carinulata]|uniref:N-acetylneuraminate lyase-like isoform X1 n=1 Tax=Diorhabda carinulata TaxID=1163345 RepID=UPI0025A2407D|nr:N-acetylneuraminate lyase-like isoform X1 [Diorhabda carinulata]
MGLLANLVNFTYRGLCAPVFTIFNKDLSINTQTIPEYARFLAKNGIDGVLVHGTTGEGVSMTVAERKAVVDVWAKVVKETKQHLMVQVGGCPLPDAVEMAKHAELVGADSILCHAELFFKPHTPSELVDYLKYVGEAAPNTPLLYYHIPGWTGININMETFINEAVKRIPTFQGIKYTSTDLEAGLAALKTNNGKHAVFLGADTLLASAFGSGFDSAIGTSLNMLPQYAVKILKAAKENNIAEARKLQHVLTEAVNIISKDGAWVPTMKVAMNLITPINVGVARPPLKNLTEAQIEDMRKSLKEIRIL